MRYRMIGIEERIHILEVSAVHVAGEHGFIDTRIDPSGAFDCRFVTQKLGLKTIQIRIDLKDLDLHCIPPIPEL